MATVLRLPSSLLMVGAALLPSGTSTSQRVLGCYWDWHALDSPALVSNRTLSSLRPGTCSYVDVTGICFFAVNSTGQLSDQQANCNGRTVMQQLAVAVADARSARRRIPDLRMYWQLSSDRATWMRVWNDTRLSDALVQQLAAWAHANPDIAHGWAIDYETEYIPPQPRVVAGVTRFLANLKRLSGVGTNWWTAFNYQFLSVANASALQPYLDHVEYGSYWNDFKSTDPHQFELSDARRLVSDHGYLPSQILLGIGLSSYSWMGTPEALLLLCAYPGFLRTDMPGCANASVARQVFATDRQSHSTIGGQGMQGRTWNELAADVAAGRAAKGSATSVRPGYGPVSSYWVFYQNASDPGFGELTYYNDNDDLDRFVSTVETEGFGGLFTWLATSDSPDWAVHRRLQRQLGRMEPRSELNVTFEAPVLVGSSGTEHYWFPSHMASLSSGQDLALIVQNCGDTNAPVGNVSNWLVSNSAGSSWVQATENGPPDSGPRPHEVGLLIGPDVHGCKNTLVAVGLEGWTNISNSVTGTQGGGFLIPAALLQLNHGLATVQAFNLTFSGFPRLVAPPATGNNAILLSDRRTLLMLSYGYEQKPAPTTHPSPWPKYTLFVSEARAVHANTSGLPVPTDWKLRSMIECSAPECMTAPGIEGPCEAQIAELANGWLMILMRFTASPVMKSISTDGGRSFSAPARTKLWSVWANLLSLPSGILVATAGRPGVGLWTSSDGYGEDWTYHNVLAEHNARCDASWRYSTVLTDLHNFSDYLACHDVEPRQTTGYTGLSVVQHMHNQSTLIISYDRLSNGWKGPYPGAKWGPEDSVFTMRIVIKNRQLNPS